MKLPLLIVSALCLPLLALSAPARAATAHNTEFETHTKNAADQGTQTPMPAHHHMKHHKKMM